MKIKGEKESMRYGYRWISKRSGWLSETLAKKKARVVGRKTEEIRYWQKDKQHANRKIWMSYMA